MIDILHPNTYWGGIELKVLLKMLFCAKVFYKVVIRTRNLTIKRMKSFVCCLAKIKIYIEDPTSNEFLINDTPCRKLGDLKNGEEKTFQITEQEAKVFVIADKSSENYCKECYILPNGQEDILLSGKCKFDATNAFRLDNNQSTDFITTCKSAPKKYPLNLIVAIIAVASPLPMIFVTSMWSLLFGVGFGIGVLGYSTLPDWILYLGLLPLSFSPLFDIFGIVLGITKIKERHSILCISLSLLGLLINFALIFAMGYIGSRY